MIHSFGRHSSGRRGNETEERARVWFATNEGIGGGVRLGLGLDLDLVRGEGIIISLTSCRANINITLTLFEH